MPWALAFAAGCMIYVVAEEMIPEMTSEGHDHFGVWSFIVGFVIMLALDCIQFQKDKCIMRFMNKKESREDYLEAILQLEKEGKNPKSIDVASGRYDSNAT